MSYIYMRNSFQRFLRSPHRHLPHTLNFRCFDKILPRNSSLSLISFSASSSTFDKCLHAAIMHQRQQSNQRTNLIHTQSHYYPNVFLSNTCSYYMLSWNFERKLFIYKTQNKRLKSFKLLLPSTDRKKPFRKKSLFWLQQKKSNPTFLKSFRIPSKCAYKSYRDFTIPSAIPFAVFSMTANVIGT